MAQYKINNLGTFTKYTPASGDTTKGYAARTTDGADLTTFLATPSNFDPYSVKMLLATSSVYPGSNPVLTTTSAVSFDPASVIYGNYSPSNVTLIEVLDYVGFDPAPDFQQHSFDLTTTPGSAIVGPPPSGALLYTPSRSMLPVFRRSTPLEAATIEIILSTLAPRDRRLLELNYAITSSDPLFQLIATAFIAAFGRGRAQVLLASQ